MKKYIPIDHPDWLYKMNFKCLKRPEMDVSIGRARILGECVRTLIIKVFISQLSYFILFFYQTGLLFLLKKRRTHIKANDEGDDEFHRADSFDLVKLKLSLG